MKDVVIWSRDACSYCVMAKNLLESKGVPYTEKKIGYGYTRDDLLLEIPSARTVPQIIIDGNVIGGFDQLKAMF